MYASEIYSPQQTVCPQSLRTAKSGRSDYGRRFRLLLPIVLISFCFIFGMMIRAYAANNGQQDVVRGQAQVSDQPVAASASNAVYISRGDTLWEIARTHKPEDADLRAYVHKMEQINHIRKGMIYEGQKIILP